MTDPSLSVPVPRRADELIVGDLLPGEALPYQFAKGPAEVIFVCDATTLGDREEWTFVAYRHEDGYHDSTTVLSSAAFQVTPADPTGMAYSRPADGDDPQQIGPREPLHTGAVTDEGLVDETRPDPAGLDDIPDEQLRETVHYRSSGLPRLVIACGAESGPHSAKRERVTCPACLKVMGRAR